MEGEQTLSIKSLNGKRVFVVEDEPLLTMVLEVMLEDLGAEMSASARSVALAIDVVNNGGFDCAILDINLGSHKSYAVAELLTERNIPFVFATGYGRCDLDGQFEQTPVIAKPYMHSDLENGLLISLGAQRTAIPPASLHLCDRRDA